MIIERLLARRARPCLCQCNYLDTCTCNYHRRIICSIAFVDSIKLSVQTKAILHWLIIATIFIYGRRMNSQIMLSYGVLQHRHQKLCCESWRPSNINFRQASAVPIAFYLHQIQNTPQTHLYAKYLATKIVVCLRCFTDYWFSFRFCWCLGYAAAFVRCFSSSSDGKDTASSVLFARQNSRILNVSHVF